MISIQFPVFFDSSSSKIFPLINLSTINRPTLDEISHIRVHPPSHSSLSILLVLWKKRRRRRREEAMQFSLLLPRICLPIIVIVLEFLFYSTRSFTHTLSLARSLFFARSDVVVISLYLFLLQLTRTRRLRRIGILSLTAFPHFSYSLNIRLENRHPSR